MIESYDKALLRAGYELHNGFNHLINAVKKDPDNWLEVIAGDMNFLSKLIHHYHYIGAQLSNHTKKHGIPVDITSSNLNAIMLMNDFNDEILAFNNFVDHGDHELQFTKFVRAVNHTNEMLLQIKLTSK